MNNVEDMTGMITIMLKTVSTNIKPGKFGSSSCQKYNYNVHKEYNSMPRYICD